MSARLRSGVLDGLHVRRCARCTTLVERPRRSKPAMKIEGLHGGSAAGKTVQPRAVARDTALAAAAIVLAALFGAFTGLPLAALLLRLPVASLADMLHQPIVVQALRLSFETTCAAALLTVLGGTPLAALLAREFRGRDAFASLVTLPLVLPPVVAGLGLLLAFGRAGLLGQTFVAAPLYVNAARAAFERTDREALDAAATLRASPVYAFCRVTLPPALAALGAGITMSAARGLGEFGATITFAGN